MLDKGTIIESVFLMLGNTDSYNDNATDEYAVADKLFTDVLRQLKLNKRYLFNSTTVKLNLAKSELNIFREYQYYQPVGMLNLIAPANIRIEGEYLYSTEQDLYISYCRDIRFEEFPNYMENVCRYHLMRELCLAYTQYAPKLQLANSLLDNAMIEVQGNETSNNSDYLEQMINSRAKYGGSFNGLEYFL